MKHLFKLHPKRNGSVVFDEETAQRVTASFWSTVLHEARGMLRSKSVESVMVEVNGNLSGIKMDVAGFPIDRFSKREAYSFTMELTLPDVGVIELTLIAQWICLDDEGRLRGYIEAAREIIRATSDHDVWKEVCEQAERFREGLRPGSFGRIIVQTATAPEKLKESFPDFPKFERFGESLSFQRVVPLRKKELLPM